MIDGKDRQAANSMSGHGLPSQPTAGRSRGLEIAAQVAARRISNVILQANRSRVMYAIVDLGPELTSAIGAAVAKLSSNTEVIEVAIHPDLAMDGLKPELIRDEVATRFRNFKHDQAIATIFSVPGQQMERVLQSLGSVERLNEAWLCDEKKAELWAKETLVGYGEELQTPFRKILRGLMGSQILVSPHMLADFCAAVEGAMRKGLTLGQAVNYALPYLRLPRDCAPRMTGKVLATKAGHQFRRWRDEYRRYLYLETNDRGFRPRGELRERLQELRTSEDLTPPAVKALESLVEDRGLNAGEWRDSQQRVAKLPWAEVSAFFDNRKGPRRKKLGEETIRHLDAEFPGELSKNDRKRLEELRTNSSDVKEEYADIFGNHRERLAEKPNLYKRWERLIFDAPVDEEDDLLRGIIHLALRACQNIDEVDDPVLVVRLRNAERISFWTEDKNTHLCGYLRDRYRGLDKALSPSVVLDFGRCWSGEWEHNLEKNNDSGSRRAEFTFEAWIVPRLALKTQEQGKQLWKGRNKAQMTWRPGHTTFATALAEDLRRVLPDGQDQAFLLRGQVSPSRGTRGSPSERVTLDKVTSITDALGESRGALANPSENGPAEFRTQIEEQWRKEMQRCAGDVLTEDDAGNLEEAFKMFHSNYSKAIAAMRNQCGEGLNANALVDQATSYGDLLKHLRCRARADILVRNLWEPLLQIGTARVIGSRNSMIITPWHPMRLAELAIKAKQAAEIIRQIVTSPSEKTAEVEQYVEDRVQGLQETYYANVGVVRTKTQKQLLIETEARSGYSLLEPPFSEDVTKLNDEPVKDAVKKFWEIADQYLGQKPHERANFSAVLLDAEAEELPSSVASHLAKQIEVQEDLRCDLTVTHENPQKLRQIYERQNRVIGHKIEDSLTSEAARIFLSRLRVGIASPESLTSQNGTKQQDIALLHNVIARLASVRWHEAPPPRPCGEMLRHVPTDISRRKSQSSGGLSTAVYLTAPSQVEPSQAYIDAVHDVLHARASDANRHFLPTQEVELTSSAVADKLEQAHAMANWVITYDRIADRRLIASSNSGLRILRYFSDPRSVHNVIVSSEVSSKRLRDRLHENLKSILPRHESEALHDLINAIHERSASLSGNIVMRGMHWDNFAQELIGIIIAQREVELLLAKGRVHRTAMFFLDEFKGWLDLSGEIADILAVSLEESTVGQGRVCLIVAEAKCVSSNNLIESEKRSWRQVERTYAAISHRFAAGSSTVDPTIWRNRLADMLVEHMDPWGDQERVAGRRFDEWTAAIREGRVEFEVSGHSIVSVHDKQHSANDLNLRVADAELSENRRRRLAQWRLGADCIAKSIRGIGDKNQDSLLKEPEQWPQAPAAIRRSPPAPKVETRVPTLEHAERKESGVIDEPRIEGSPRRVAHSKTTQLGAGTIENLGNFERSAAAHLDAVTAVTSSGSPSDTAGSTIRRLEKEDSATSERHTRTTRQGWRTAVYEAVQGMRSPIDERAGQVWLKEIVEKFKQALQAEEMEAPVRSATLTPNSALLHVGGQRLTVKWLQGKQTDLMTRYGVGILRITPLAGRIAVALKRPKRGILHLSEVWSRRKLEPSAPSKNLALVVGEQEDDGALFYISLESDFEGQEQAAPHTLVSGTTGSGKGILVSNLILDVCAFNDPLSVQVYLIDPKRGADYLWARGLPHLREGIVEDKDAAIALLRRLVAEMEERYRQITQAGCANISQFNRNRDTTQQLPRVIIFFDEVANWMQDEEFKKEVETVINEIATKSRAAGLHLIMIYQRADKDVMTMQLRTNLGNKLILRLGDEGSSRIALGEKGAEDLQGKGHVIAKLGTNDKIYGQVPFIEQEEARTMANAIAEAWTQEPR